MTDLEKGLEGATNPVSLPHDPQPLPTQPPLLRPVRTSDEHSAQSTSADSTLSSSKLALWARRVEKATGVEARGIHRVDESEKSAKTTLSFMQIVILWLSINTAAQNITLASIGGSVFGLGFRDTALLGMFGCVIGSVPAAYTATWGPVSGNRTLVFARYTMGWWPTKICVLLYIVLLLGYSMIDAVIAGQMLSAVSANGNLTVVAGIIIVSAVTWIVTTFGIRIFHYYERYAWLPQYAVLLILAGTAGPKFDTTTPSTGPNGLTISGNRLSFFSVCLSSAITYAPGSADFLVYCDPKITPRWKVFTAVLIGLSVSFSFCMILGAGLGSGVGPTNPAWEAAGGGSGALIVAGYEGLGGFGKFCSVVVALGLIANMVPPVYSSGIDFQILGRYTAMVPRFIWNTFSVIVFAVCALAGKDHLAEIFTNFLALMGYWVAIWIAITLEEQFLFRREKGYVWTDWNKKDRLPLGIAAFVAFGIGWAGAVLCMAQVYYIGPLAKLVGDYGGDMGNFVGFGLGGVVYPGLRAVEVRLVGR